MIFGWFRKKPELADEPGSTVVVLECLDKSECKKTFEALKVENDYLRSLVGIDNHTN